MKLDILRHEIRCPQCNKLILKGKFWGDYSIEYMCPRCKTKIELNKIDKKTNFDKKENK